MGRGRALLVLSAVATGLTAEWVAFGWDDAAQWVPDLATGWTWIASGLVLLSARSGRGVAVLMTVMGFTWFLGNFAALGGAAGWVAAHGVYVHRGPLVHLLLCYPSARAARRIDRIAVAVGYAAAVVSPLWESVVATTLLVTLVVVLVARASSRAIGSVRRGRRIALWASGSLWFVLVTQALVRHELASSQAQDVTLLAYEAVLCVIAVAFLAGIVTDPWRRAGVTDLVVEVGDAPSSRLRDALAEALGDPTLELGYWLPTSGAFVDADGRTLRLPEAGAPRSVTVIERDGGPVAALVHDPAVLDDAAVVHAVGAAAELAAANARLRATVLEQIAELHRSRRRIIDAADDERRDLEGRVQRGTEQRLIALVALVRHARMAASDDETRMRAQRAESQLVRAVDDVRELARGLHPRELSERGLHGALQALADRAPMPVSLSVDAGPLPRAAEVAAYFVCAEALANVAKHAA